MLPVFGKLFRKKIVEKESASQLNRVLSTLDLTLLGIGSTLGIGVYVLAGSVAKESAGPAVVISFLVAALASVLAGLCYAEFGSRVPKAGSAYVYSYVCVGELIAFVVGWNLIMEYVIGVASVAKGYSGYVDQVAHHKLSQFFLDYMPINTPYLAEYFDLMAFSITFVLTIVLACGVKESSVINNVFTVLNLAVVLFTVIAGSFYADTQNWKLTKEEILNMTSSRNITISDEKIGVGGFAPFGFKGIMKGAATCFYGFVGFDCIATTGEEAKNPQKSIPLAIIFSLLFIFLAYFGISTVVTMMVPYYMQDLQAPLPEAFRAVGFGVGGTIVTIGALFGLSTSLLGAMFPMPRVIYSMASDGVLFKFLSKVHPRYQTPLIATIIAGTFGGLMSAIFKLEALIDMMSIGTLTAYTLVAVCVLCLRYRKDVDGADNGSMDGCTDVQPVTFSSLRAQMLNPSNLRRPTEISSAYTNWAVALYCIFTIAFCAVAIFAEDNLVQVELLYVILLATFGLLMIFMLITLAAQPVSGVKLAFKVPFVPVIPGLSILANVYLIMKLSGITWIRFSGWMAIGFLIYGICLWNGTADESYAASVKQKLQRKYSRVSVSGIYNGGFDGDAAKKTGGNGNVARNQSDQDTLELPHFSSVQDKESGLKRNGVIKGPVEQEIIEKTLVFDENDSDTEQKRN